MVGNELVSLLCDGVIWLGDFRGLRFRLRWIRLGHADPREIGPFR